MLAAIGRNAYMNTEVIANATVMDGKIFRLFIFLVVLLLVLVFTGVEAYATAGA